MKPDAGHALLLALLLGAVGAAVDNGAERDRARAELEVAHETVAAQHELVTDLRARVTTVEHDLDVTEGRLRAASARATHFRTALIDQRSRDERVRQYLQSRFSLNPDSADVLAQHIVDAATRASRRYGVSVDATMVAAQISTESSWNARAQSSAGALGLMQVMPGHVERYDFLHSVQDLLNPRLNIRAGTFVLAEALRQFESPRAALRAYHGGPRAVHDPKQVTLDYERVVMQRWQELS